jgi:hypothetical protein
LKAVFCPVKLKRVHCERDGLCDEAVYALSAKSAIAVTPTSVIVLCPVLSKALELALNC